jgi:hypothetical protein
MECEALSIEDNVTTVHSASRSAGIRKFSAQLSVVVGESFKDKTAVVALVELYCVDNKTEVAVYSLEEWSGREANANLSRITLTLAHGDDVPITDRDVLEGGSWRGGRADRDLSTTHS